MATVRIFAYETVQNDPYGYFAYGASMSAYPVLRHGSGVVVSSDGLIVTAKHVVHGATLLAVKPPGARQAFVALPVYEDPEMDFALIVVPGREFPCNQPLPAQGGVPQLRTQTPLVTLGYPVDATATTPTTHRGIISRLTEDGLLQTDAPLNPGHSGGPVFVMGDDGQVLVGVAIYRYADPSDPISGMGFVQPIQPVLSAMETDIGPSRLIERARDSYEDNPDRATVLEASASVLGRIIEAISDPEATTIALPQRLVDDMMTVPYTSLTPGALLLVAGTLTNDYTYSMRYGETERAWDIVQYVGNNFPEVLSTSPWALSVIAAAIYNQYTTYPSATDPVTAATEAQWLSTCPQFVSRFRECIVDTATPEERVLLEQSLAQNLNCSTIPAGSTETDLINDLAFANTCLAEPDCYQFITCFQSQDW